MGQVGCFVPARLGSKRLRRKNLRELGGVPMLVHTIRCGLACFDEVHVCTESAEIAEVAVAHGATVLELLPEELGGDLVPSWRPCLAIADRLGEAGRSVDALACLQPTSPLRTPGEIRAALTAYASSGADFAVSVTPIDPHFFHWALEDAEEGWRMVFGTQYMKERPLLPPRYRPNGSIKIAEVEALRATGHFFGPRLTCVETPEETSVHVATEIDLVLCEALLQRRSQ